MTHSSDDIWQNIRIATPCKANWDQMTGDEQVRACAACHKNVYNISMMSRTEAEEVIRAKEGNLCIRLYRRWDGRILTSDCPKALRAVRLKMVMAMGFLVATVGGWLGFTLVREQLNNSMMQGGMASHSGFQGK
jgi:hypothetical protein